MFTRLLRLFSLYFEPLTPNHVTQGNSLFNQLHAANFEKVKDISNVKLHISLKPEFSCAICGITINGMTPGELNGTFFNNYTIHITGMDVENIHCVRVTPQVYTRLQDLDVLIKAINEIAAKKISPISQKR